MATPAEVAQHRSAVNDIATLAVAQLVAEFDALPGDNPTALAGPLTELIDALAADFTRMSALIAADFYEDLRAESGLTDRYTATLADPPAIEDVRDFSNWAASAAYVDEEKALRDAATVLDRFVMDADRGTIDLNIDRDPAAPRFARYASADACAFCAMNAMRGPAYRSEDTAGGKYHNHCRCLAVPVWSPRDYQEAPYVADWREAYYSARDAGNSDTRTILAHMRSEAGFR